MENNKCPKIDDFCYVCGHVVPRVEKQERKKFFSEDFKLAYTHYFDETDTSGEDFTPNTVCKSCYTVLIGWLHKKNVSLPFSKPVIWINDPNGHDESRCYACTNFSVGLTRIKSRSKKYVAAFNAVLPVNRPANVEPPKPPSPDVLSRLTAETLFTNPTNVQDFDWTPDVEDDTPKPLTQNEMDYIVAKLGLSQRNSEMLTSFLKCRKLTQPNVTSTSYRKRQAAFQTFYTVDDSNTLTYCNDIHGLVNKLELNYIADDWRLFIDGSVSSLKAVLLHKSNKKPSIPLAFGTNMKESYETLADILDKIKYADHKWKICCDLKVINIMQGIIEKGGYPKFFCFLCIWNTREKNQYRTKDWKKRTPELNKQMNLRNKPLIENVEDILLPPLHIKLGIVKKFIEMAVKDVQGVFECLKEIFPKLSDDKIRNGTYCDTYLYRFL